MIGEQIDNYMNNNLNGWMMLNYTAAYFYSEGNSFSNIIASVSIIKIDCFTYIR